MINRSTVREWQENYRDAKEALEAWYFVVTRAKWEGPTELLKAFPRSSVLGGPQDRVCFRIRGNHYRLIAGMNYPAKMCFCKFFGTHSEYDDIDALTVGG